MEDIKKGKPRKVRGWVTMHSDASFEFRPQEEGTPAKKDERKHGKSAFYKTTGEKDSSIVAHLRVDANSVDPVAEMYDELKYFTKNLQKKEPVVPRCKKLLEKPGVEVWHRQKEHKVIVQLEIPTDSGQELSSLLFNLTSEVNKCFAINATSLTQRK